MSPYFQKVWRIPIALAILTIFGLLAALLGTGLWHAFSWLALTIPIAAIFVKINTRPAANKKANAGKRLVGPPC